MPIKIKPFDNESFVKVYVNSNDNIKINSDTETQTKALESKLNQEILERKSADTDLQQQVTSLSTSILLKIEEEYVDPDDVNYKCICLSVGNI